MILVSGCGSSLSEFEPRNEAEAGIKRLFIILDGAIRNRDAEGIATLLHPDAKVMIWEGKRKTISRARYLKMLPQRLAKAPVATFSAPKIQTSSDGAGVLIYMKYNKSRVLMTYDLIREGDIWLIRSWKF